MKFLYASLMLAALAIYIYSQLPSSFRNEVPAVTVSAPNENRVSGCDTPGPEYVVIWSIYVYERSPLAWLTGNRAVQFADFYAQIVPHLSGLVADEVVALDYRGTSKVFVMLFNQRCLAAVSPLEGNLFNEVMGAIGVEGRKPSEIERLIISSPPGFNI